MTPRPTDSSVAKAFWEQYDPESWFAFGNILLARARTLDAERGGDGGLSMRYFGEVLDPLWQRAGNNDQSYQTARAFDKVLESADELIAEHVATIERLTAQVEADRKDAERYRWLREHAKPFDILSSVPYARIRIVLIHDDLEATEFGIIGASDRVGVAGLDTAMDAAIGAQIAGGNES